MPVTVLIVDDDAGFRTVAGELLQAGGFEVVGQAWDDVSALRESARLRPQIVLLDVQLGAADGFTVCGELLAGTGAPAVVMTSSRAASAYREKLAGCGAKGFIAKEDLSGPELAALVAGPG